MEWFEETFHPRWRQRIRMEKVLHRQQSAFQELLVFESADFGRVLALDGVLQTTERDEYISTIQWKARSRGYVRSY